jgi:hypothetical protein
MGQAASEHARKRLSRNSGELRDDRPLRQVTNDVGSMIKAAVLAGLSVQISLSKQEEGVTRTFGTTDSSGSIRKIETFSQVNGNDGSISGRTLVHRRSVSGLQCQGTARSRI